MKKYLMFMLCVVFAVSFVCCGGRGSRENAGRQVQVNPKSTADSTDSKGTTPDGTASKGTSGTDSADSKLIVYLGRPYRVTVTVDEDVNTGIFTITDPASGEEASTTLNIADNTTDSIKANVQELGVKIDGDNDSNKIFVALCKSNKTDKVDFIMCHAPNMDSFEVDNLRIDKNLMDYYSFSESFTWNAVFHKDISMLGNMRDYGIR